MRGQELLIVVHGIYPDISISTIPRRTMLPPSEKPVTRPAEKPSKVIITAAWLFLEG